VKRFLTAEWRDLALLNFEADPAILGPYIPAGTELDTWRGKTLISMVGFRFFRTRVFGIPIPFHGVFDEVNLRFYVRRAVAGEVRRAVTFVREIVPKRAVIAVARWAYNEPYMTCPMRSEQQPDRMEYGWEFGGRWNHLAVIPGGALQPLEAGFEAAFITEHYWGYTRQRDGGTLEYRVEHPRWRVAPVADTEFDCDALGLYGPAFAEVLRGKPFSAMLAEGSSVPSTCRREFSFSGRARSRRSARFSELR
jgi:uncharacterized protein YqjF (DUF2071 family)